MQDLGHQGDGGGDFPIHMGKGAAESDESSQDAGQYRGDAAAGGGEAAQGVAVQAADDARGQPDPGAADDAADEDADNTRAGQGPVDAGAVIGRHDGQETADDRKDDGGTERQGSQDILTEPLFRPTR